MDDACASVEKRASRREGRQVLVEDEFCSLLVCRLLRAFGQRDQSDSLSAAFDPGRERVRRRLIKEF